MAVSYVRKITTTLFSLIMHNIGYGRTRYVFQGLRFLSEIQIMQISSIPSLSL